MKTQSVHISDFFAREVRDYSIYACQRAIPSGIDGLKPSQRKALFGMQKKFTNQEVKVSIASAGIMEISSYHHGSLDGVIVGMSQNFTGSNNISLLEGIGQFGSRISPDASASRYIFTKLSSSCKTLFSSIDDAILEWNDDDGVPIEPKYYLPVLPLVLVNGANGMGTGFACDIAAYDPLVLKDSIQKMLTGKKLSGQLTPWYKGFTGTITKEVDQCVITGAIEVMNTSTLKITELPVGMYTVAYRNVLNSLEDKEIIKSYEDNCSEEKTEFVVKVSREVAAKPINELLKTFKLISRNTENITVWDENEKIRRFDSADDLLKWFVEFRLKKYEERRQYIIVKLGQDQSRLEEQMKFIKMYLKRSKAWSEMKTASVEEEMATEGLVNISELLSIRISRLTGDTISELADKISMIKNEIVDMQNKTATDLYLADLKTLKL